MSEILNNLKKKLPKKINKEEFLENLDKYGIPYITFEALVGFELDRLTEIEWEKYSIMLQTTLDKIIELITAESQLKKLPSDKQTEEIQLPVVVGEFLSEKDSDYTYIPSDNFFDYEEYFNDKSSILERNRKVIIDTLQKNPDIESIKDLQIQTKLTGQMLYATLRSFPELKEWVDDVLGYKILEVVDGLGDQAASENCHDPMQHRWMATKEFLNRVGSCFTITSTTPKQKEERQEAIESNTTFNLAIFQKPVESANNSIKFLSDDEFENSSK